MSQESEDISKWIQELVTRSSRQQAQAIQRLGSLVQRMASGELDQNRVRDEYTHFVQDESTRFVEDLTRLGLSFQTALLELNRKYSERFFDQVLGSSAAPSQPNGQPAARKQVTLALSGSPGDELARKFMIENKRDEAEMVTFLVSEFSADQGGEAFRPPLQLEPARLSLSPGEEKAVTLRLPLLPEFFSPGETYRAEIIARGHREVTLLLSVSVLASGDEPAPGLEIHPAANRDDLTHIDGIGAAYAARLNAAGIHSYADLANAAPAHLEQLIGKDGAARAERGRWRQQAARLAGLPLPDPDAPEAA